MKTLKAKEAGARLCQLMDEAAETHRPIYIIGERSNAVLLSEDDWRAVSETLYLLSLPGMRESIQQGMKEPIDSCSKVLDG